MVVPFSLLSEVDPFGADAGDAGAELLGGDLLGGAEAHLDGVILVDVAEETLAAADDQVVEAGQMVG